MNLAQLRGGVYARAGQQTNDPVFTQQVINGYINDAMHMVEADQDWPWLDATTTFTTQAGVDTYPMSTFAPNGDWARTHYLIVGQQRPMARFSMEELDSRWPASTMTGQPFEWAVDTDQLVVRPVPDAAYTIKHRYLRGEPDLIGDAQSPLMPAKFHAAICELATWLALRSDREDPRAVACFQAYQQWQTRMKDDRRRASSPNRVRIRPGGWV